MIATVLVAMLVATSVASAAPISGYKCKAGGGKARLGKGCKCPKGKVSKRDSENAAVCVAKAKKSKKQSKKQAVVIEAIGRIGHATAFEASQAPTADYLLGQQIVIPSKVTLKKFGVLVLVGGAVRLALYTDASGAPDRLVAATATTTTVPGSVEIDITAGSIPLAAGTYWLMATFDGHTSIGFTQSDATNTIAYRQHSLASALPGTFGAAVTYTGQSFNFYLVVASGSTGSDTSQLAEQARKQQEDEQARAAERARQAAEEQARQAAEQARIDAALREQANAQLDECLSTCEHGETSCKEYIYADRDVCIAQCGDEGFYACSDSCKETADYRYDECNLKLARCERDCRQ